MKLHRAFRLALEPATPDIVAFVGGGGKTSTMFRLAQEIVATGSRVVTTTTTHIAQDQTGQSPAVVMVEGATLPLDEIGQALDTHGQCLLVGPAAKLNSIVKRRGIAPEQVDQLAQMAAQLGLGAILVEADGSRNRPLKAPAAHEPALSSSTTLLVPVVGMDAIGRRVMEPFVHRPERIARLLSLSEAQAASTRLSPAMIAHLLIHPAGGAQDCPAGARLLPLLNKAETPTHFVGARMIATLLARQRIPVLIGATGIGAACPIRERWGATVVVVLAGGRSQRMGSAKQLLVVDGEPMVVRAARVALQSGAHQVVVVTGAYAGEVETTLLPLRARTGERLQVVYNEAWQVGQSTTMHAGLRGLAHGTEMAIFMPVDQPFLQPLLLRRMMGAWQKGARLVAPLVNGQVRGAPGLFDRSLWPELLAVQGDSGGRDLFKRYAEQTVTFNVAAAQVRDLDTPADLPD